jgi:hypothetical protein
MPFRFDLSTDYTQGRVIEATGSCAGNLMGLMPPGDLATSHMEHLYQCRLRWPILLSFYRYTDACVLPDSYPPLSSAVWRLILSIGFHGPPVAR